MCRSEEIEIWMQENRSDYNIMNYLVLAGTDYGQSNFFKNNYVKIESGHFDDQALQKSMDTLSKRTEQPESIEYLHHKLMIEAYSNQLKPTIHHISARVMDETQKSFISGTLYTLFQNRIKSHEALNNKKRKMNDEERKTHNAINAISGIITGYALNK